MKRTAANTTSSTDSRGTSAMRCRTRASSASPARPIEKTDANTRAVFGDYISIYDIQRAVADKATVPIYYESYIAKLGLNASELPKIAAEFKEITEGEEMTKKEKLKTKWAALEALVGDPKRIALVAADLVAHFEKRVEAMDGKAMIVCMSRRRLSPCQSFPCQRPAGFGRGKIGKGLNMEQRKQLVQRGSRGLSPHPGSAPVRDLSELSVGR